MVVYDLHRSYRICEKTKVRICGHGQSGQYAELVASVDQVQEMRSPAYDRGATVEEIKEKYKTYYNQI